MYQPGATPRSGSRARYTAPKYHLPLLLGTCHYPHLSEPGMSFPSWPPKSAGKCPEFATIPAPRGGSLMVANTCMHRVAMQRWYPWTSVHGGGVRTLQRRVATPERTSKSLKMNSLCHQQSLKVPVRLVGNDKSSGGEGWGEKANLERPAQKMRCSLSQSRRR
jgi:hypothetical protein